MACKYSSWNRGQDEALLNILGGQEVAELIIARKVRVTIEEIVAEVKNYFRLISADQEIMIGECDGTETLARANDSFTGYLDQDFQNWGTDVTGESTPVTRVAVYELLQNGRFDQFFPSLNTDIDRLCLSQAQIKRFVQDHRTWLPHKWATLFLFKVAGQFFVACVRVDVYGQLEAYVLRFSYAYVWYGQYRSRVVVPQLKV